MELILLPGNSKRNKEWTEEVASKIKDLFEKAHIHYYKHWQTEEEIISIKDESLILSDYLKNKKDYFIFAKSIGSALAIKNIKKKKISPNKCLFLGLPVLWCREHNIPLDSWINEYSIPTLFIQNSNDPVISANELKDYLIEGKVKNYKFIELEGNSHDYNNIKQIRKLLEDFLL